VEKSGNNFADEITDDPDYEHGQEGTVSKQGKRSNKRREERFLLAVIGAVKLTNSGRVVKTRTVNISGCGALVQFEEPVEVAIGDALSCQYCLPEAVDESLPQWIQGRVVRVDGPTVAINFEAGVFRNASAAAAEAGR